MLHFGTFASAAVTSVTLVAASVLLAACPSDEGSSCVIDGECADICSRIGECILEDNAMDIRVRWTVEGEVPSPQSPLACDAHPDLELTFVAAEVREPDSVFYPVPCSLGTTFYDRMPYRFSSIRLTAVDRDTGTRSLSGTAVIRSRSSEVAIDLR